MQMDWFCTVHHDYSIRNATDVLELYRAMNYAMKSAYDFQLKLQVMQGSCKKLRSGKQKIKRMYLISATFKSNLLFMVEKYPLSIFDPLFLNLSNQKCSYIDT